MCQSAGWCTQLSRQKINEDIGGYGRSVLWHKICGELFFEKRRTCYFTFLSNSFTKYISNKYITWSTSGVSHGSPWPKILRIISFDAGSHLICLHLLLLFEILGGYTLNSWTITEINEWGGWHPLEFCCSIYILRFLFVPRQQIQSRAKLFRILTRGASRCLKLTSLKTLNYFFLQSLCLNQMNNINFSF
jgi:hypothetical protein